MLLIHNNLTKRKVPFRPIDPANVRMYVCGMTVYDMCHIGHARALVVFDVVYRYLCDIYGRGHVTYVRNITDIDDKIIARANENNEPLDHLTGRFIDEMNQDADALGVLRPNQEPRATRHMDEIIAMIQALVQKGYAYCGDNGDVYYDVSKFEHYGQLSGKNLKDLRAGTRVAVDEAKDDPLDFVLWKAAKPGEPSWDSPWGAGRPGWHIECSAMSTQCLGNHFDIHGGGMDLQFPHHENEIAQSEGATGEPFVNVWMHNGFVRVDEEKMSKSLGNFFTIREVLEKYDAEVLRYFILTSHYRSPLNYSDQHLDNAKGALTTLYTALRGLDEREAISKEAYAEDYNCLFDGAITIVEGPDDERGATKETDAEDYSRRFHAAMDDDFNTPEALAVLFDLAREINKQRTSNPTYTQSLATTLWRMGGLVGLLGQDPEAFLKGSTQTSDASLSESEIESLIEARQQAKQNKDYTQADRIRDDLKSQGIILEDGPQGTTWRRE